MTRVVRLVSASAMGLSLLAAVFVLLPDSAEAQEDVDGQEIYLSSCSACHQPDGLGVPSTFPPLSGNPAVQDTDYVQTVITDGLTGPIEVLGITYDGVMPPITNLSDAEIDAVTAYIQADVFAEAEGTDLEPGEPSTGESIFLGSQRLENAGPACASCHTAAEHQAMYGPTLGPDLTDLATRYGGEDGVAAALSNPPSATMQPLFAGAPLTDQERADLAAYFETISDEQPAVGNVDIMLLGGVIGAVIFFALMLLATRSRRPGFADQLRSRQ